MSGPDNRLAAGPVAEPAPLAIAGRAVQVRQALAALGTGDAQRAFLIADRLCRDATARTTHGFLLRAAALTRLGEPQAAERDLARASHVDPFCPATNRALLRNADSARRHAAQRRLLKTDGIDERAAALAALAADGFACVITGEQAQGGFDIEVAWSGTSPLTVEIRSDLGSTEAKVIAPDRGSASDLNNRARFTLPYLAGVNAVRITAPGLKTLTEPTTFLAPALRPEPISPEPIGPGEQGHLLIIVPVYDDLAATRTCLETTLAARPSRRTCRIVVVDDCTPDPALAGYLDQAAAEGTIEVVRNPFNLGFAGSVNRALRHRASGADVLLLNADTVLPRGVIDKLAAHVDAAPDIGTVTPLSNNGEDTSIPRRFEVNPLPDPGEIERIDATAGRLNRGQAIDLPNGVGFCLYVRGDLLDQVGVLSTEFGRGYYEDVEFCLRAAAAGYRNVAALDAYVGHHGGRSFAGEKRALVGANARRLALRFPGFRDRARRFEREDPIRAALAGMNDALLAEGPPIDLLMMSDDVPDGLSLAIGEATAEHGAGLVVVGSRIEANHLHLAFTAHGGGHPQTLAWSCDETTADAVPRLRDRLCRLPVRRLTLVDCDGLPALLRDAVGAWPGPVRRIVTAAPHAELPRGDALPAVFATTPAVAASGGVSAAPCLAYPTLPSLQIIRPDMPCGIVAIIPQRLTLLGWAFVRALAAHLPSSVSPVIAGDAPTEVAPELFASGAIGDDELPQWLARVGASAAFFPSLRWGIADPRVWSWARLGLPTLCFDPGATTVTRDDGRWTLPSTMTPQDVASLLTRACTKTDPARLAG